MFSTSLAVVTLSGLLGPSAPQPNWQTDYGAAVAKANEQKRPLALFVTGGTDPARVVSEGDLSDESLDKLQQGYVAVLVNTKTEDGKKLASAFKLTEGLVISDRSGNLQALRHAGQIPAADLSKYLTKYAASSEPVTTTVVTGTAAEPARPAPTFTPVTAAPVVVSPVMQPTFASPAVGGSCPNCRGGR